RGEQQSDGERKQRQVTHHVEHGPLLCRFPRPRATKATGGTPISHLPSASPLLMVDGGSAKERSCRKPSLSPPPVPPLARRRERCPRLAPTSCSPTSCARSSNAPVSIPKRSKTWSPAASPKSASRGSTSRARLRSSLASPSRSLAPPSTGS